MEKVCFVFKNNKEANFYFKNVKMKLYNGYFYYNIYDNSKSMLLPYKRMSLLERILIKLHILKAKGPILYVFRSQNTISDFTDEYEKYYFLDDKIDYMPQFMELMF